MRRVAFLAALALAPTGVLAWESGMIVDLSHAYDEQTIFWPTETGFVLEKEFDGRTDKGYYYRSNRLSTPEHGGTHIDAPAHFSEQGETVDRIPLERLIGSAILVDVSRQCAADRDYRVTVADFEAWEKRHGEIPRGAIVLLRTGFGRRWPDRKAYLGTDERGAGAVAKLHFPGLDSTAARWLVEERVIRAIGLDTASIDYGQSTLFESHVALSAADVPAMENLANLEKLPETGMTVIALPMKVRRGSGGPLRAVAIIEKK